MDGGEDVGEGGEVGMAGRRGEVLVGYVACSAVDHDSRSDLTGWIFHFY